MSLANALIFAASSAAFGGIAAFVGTVWLAHREMNAMRDEFNAVCGEYASENGVLRTKVQRAEAEAEHAAMERDAILDDNLRMHKTIRRHVGKQVA